MSAKQIETPQDAELGQIGKLTRQLETIRSEIEAFAVGFASQTAALSASQRISARNLLHYVALRRCELREIQHALSALGLSSLGRAEPHVLANLDALLRILRYLLTGQRAVKGSDDAGVKDYDAAAGLLRTRSEALLGPEPPRRAVRIMVTMPSEAASDYALVKQMVAAGMDCARINCAHDEADAWIAMVGHVRRAQEEVGKPCRVLMDLAGVKPRIGAIEPGPPVIKGRPKRDEYGRVLAPARIWLSSGESPTDAPANVDLSLSLPGAWVAQLAVGDRIELTDARDANRRLTVT